MFNSTASLNQFQTNVNVNYKQALRLGGSRGDTAWHLALKENKQGASDDVKFALKQDGEGQDALTLLGGVCLFALKGHRDMEKEGDKGQTNRSHPQRRDTGFNEDNMENYHTLACTVTPNTNTQTGGKRTAKKTTEFALECTSMRRLPLRDITILPQEPLLGRDTSTNAGQRREHESRRDPSFFSSD